MRLLVTNDDGVDSAFLQELVRALVATGHEIFVAAPRHEQSWVGAGKSRSRPVHSTPADKGLGCPTWVVDGTPSDCVNIALDHLLPPLPGGEPAVDGVVSGINVGLNASLGFIIASGTIAGAWEGALHGLPGVALSQEVSFETYERLKAAGPGGPVDPELLATLRVSSRHAASLIPGLVANTPRRRFIIHNLNFPAGCRPDTPVRRTVPAHLLVPRLFTPQDGEGTHRLVFNEGEDVSPAGLLTDRVAVGSGWISHSVLDYTRLGAE
jgi:5'-nucleotidase